MAFAPMIFSGLSAVVSAVGALQQGRAAGAAADFNAQVAEQNSQIARQKAAADVSRADRQNRIRLGAARAAAGASGGVGNAIDVLGDIAAQGELEKQNIMFEGELAARGFENTAALERSRAGSSRGAGALAASSALLSGGSQTFGLLKRA